MLQGSILPVLGDSIFNAAGAAGGSVDEIDAQRLGDDGLADATQSDTVG